MVQCKNYSSRHHYHYFQIMNERGGGRKEKSVVVDSITLSVVISIHFGEEKLLLFKHFYLHFWKISLSFCKLLKKGNVTFRRIPISKESSTDPSLSFSLFLSPHGLIKKKKKKIIPRRNKRISSIRFHRNVSKQIVGEGETRVGQVSREKLCNHDKGTSAWCTRDFSYFLFPASPFLR